MAQHRRVAQWQSASKHTEEVAAFDSCPAYQKPKPDILCLAHCVPNPPDKGEKIRLHHILRHLAPHYRIHLACFAQSRAELESAHELSAIYESGYLELLPPFDALFRGATTFILGGCLNEAYYRSDGMQRYVTELQRRIRLHSSLVYTAVMGQYAPRSVPAIMDMVDVDSEKWFQYAAYRFPGLLYGMEARRLRQIELRYAETSLCTLLTTQNEQRFLQSFAPGVRSNYLENGVDLEYFDGAPRPLDQNLQGRRFIVFVGTMNYYPNVDAAVWFAREVFPQLRERDPDMEFVIVGRDPTKAVQALAVAPGVKVTGRVADVRPYLAGARAVVAPLRLARGIQNKVLEALAMGRSVFASAEVCRTFGDRLPPGVECCASSDAYIAQLPQACSTPPSCIQSIRDAARERFNWHKNLAIIDRELSIEDENCLPSSHARY